MNKSLLKCLAESRDHYFEERRDSDPNQDELTVGWHFPVRLFYFFCTLVYIGDVFLGGLSKWSKTQQWQQKENPRKLICTEASSSCAVIERAKDRRESTKYTSLYYSTTTRIETRRRRRRRWGRTTRTTVSRHGHEKQKKTNTGDLMR